MQKYDIRYTHMRSPRHLVKQPDANTRTMRKGIITTPPNIQNTPFTLTLPKTIDKGQI